MSDERYQPRVRNAGTKNSIQIGYDTEKLKQENRYRVKGQAFPKTFDGFNWGAVLLTPIWGCFNGKPVIFFGLAFYLIPYLGIFLGIIFSLYCGTQGNKWAWENKQWNDLRHFHETQRKWAIAGLITYIIIIAVLHIVTINMIQNFKSGY
jgi:hypothetical protein